MTSTWPAIKSSSRYKKNHGSSLLGTFGKIMVVVLGASGRGQGGIK